MADSLRIGNETRYDRDGGGNHIDSIRRQGGEGLAIQFGKRFCETCQTVKPKDATPAKKGWKCKDCRAKK